MSESTGLPGLVPLLDGYQYDVFISYRRSGPGTAAQWVHNHFYDMLVNCLADELGDTAVFMDRQVETGTHWPTLLRQALARSKMLVAVWSPPYFTSSWCLAEWQTMLARERVLGGRTQLVYSLGYADGKNFPGEAKERQCRSVHKVSNPFPAFVGSHRQADLHDEVRLIAGELVELLERVPPWQSNWPACEVPVAAVVTPTTFPVYQP